MLAVLLSNFGHSMPVRAVVDHLSGSDNEVMEPEQRGAKSRAIKAMKAMKVVAKKKAGLFFARHLILMFNVFEYMFSPEGVKKACQKAKKNLHKVWHVKGKDRLPKFGCAISCTKMSARVVAHKIKLAKVGKISNYVPRFIATTMAQLCFLAWVLYGFCCELAFSAGLKVHCPAATAKSKKASSWSSISQVPSFQSRLSIWALTTTEPSARMLFGHNPC